MDSEFLSWLVPNLPLPGHIGRPALPCFRIASRRFGRVAQRRHHLHRRPGLRRRRLLRGEGVRHARTSTSSRRRACEFTDFHVSQPVCSASRASLLTGCYANRLGIHGALGPNARHGIHADETTHRRGVQERRATRPAWSASGTSATTRSSSPRGTGSTRTSACRTRTTCGRTTRRPRRAPTRRCRCSRTRR